MLYEFAMTPELFDASTINSQDGASIILIEILRGIAENGLLANFHKDRWLRHINTKITSLSPALQDKIRSCFEIIDNRHRLVRRPKCMKGDPASDQEWLDLALYSHQRIPFHAIILSQLLLDHCKQECNAFVEFLGALDSPQWQAKKRRTLTLTKSHADYRTALTPILRYAKSLSLIDPWLNSHESRYFDTVEICSNLMGQRGHSRLNGRINIHAEAGKQKPDNLEINDYLDAWEQKIRPLVGNDGHRFRVFLWESLPDSEKLHDRFILTDQCGISVPGGLDCRAHSHANSTDWSLLDEKARVNRWNNYSVGGPFSLVGTREIQRE